MSNLADLSDYAPEPAEVPAGIPRVYINGDTATDDKPNVVSRITNRLLGINGEERYQLWPEKVVRSALTTIPEGMAGKIPQWEVDPETGAVHTSQEMIARSLDMASLAGVGGIGGTTDATLGATPFLRPALKYKDRLYKGKEGQGHQDVIPDALYPEFQRMAMSGEDISHYNFGFVNDKGHFLDREAALKYGIDTGLIDPQAGKFGALTSTLMADSSKPGMAIEAMAKTYPLAKPTDRFSNTLGQNDHLIQNMSPDEFLKSGRPLKIDAESRETINNLKQHIKEGKPLDPLELHANGKEDGRHRAIAAKELGIKEVPVINFREPFKVDPFYSALEHNVKGIKQEKMNGDAWLGTLANKPGVKPEELDWTGLRGFLEENKGKPVTKSQIEEHLAANKVELKEVNKGTGELEQAAEDLQKAAGNEPIAIKNHRDKLYPDEIEQGLWSGDIAIKDLPTNLQAPAEKMLNLRHQQENPTKYQSYQLPGGENYREMLLTLPEQNKMKWERTPEGNLSAEGYTIKKEPNGYITYGNNGRRLSAHDSEEMAKSLVETAKSNSPNAQIYRSSHWDEPNILAHVRMNDRTIEGKKSLHLEEIQSDWHQQGRDKGYNNNKQEFENLKKKLQADPKSLTDDEVKRFAELENNYQLRVSGVPDAPFKKTWHELALKRMIREAAEKGYDRLSWTPGEAQAARYDLSKQVSAIKAHNNGNGEFVLDLTPHSNSRNGMLTRQIVTKDKLSDVVGKELAEKIISQNEPTKVYSDLDLKLGHSGMKGFYDQIIPKSVNKIAKEYGTKVETGKTNDGHTIHYIDLSESLKNVALQKGFPLFSSTHMYVPINHDPFEKKK